MSNKKHFLVIPEHIHSRDKAHEITKDMPIRLKIALEAHNRTFLKDKPISNMKPSKK